MSTCAHLLSLGSVLVFIDCVNSRNRSSTKLSAQYFGILECKLSGPEALLDFKDVNDTKTSDSVKVMSDNWLAIITRNDLKNLQF